MVQTATPVHGLVSREDQIVHRGRIATWDTLPFVEVVNRITIGWITQTPAGSTPVTGSLEKATIALNTAECSSTTALELGFTTCIVNT